MVRFRNSPDSIEASNHLGWELSRHLFARESSSRSSLVPQAGGNDLAREDALRCLMYSVGEDCPVPLQYGQETTIRDWLDPE